MTLRLVFVGLRLVGALLAACLAAGIVKAAFLMPLLDLFGGAKARGSALAVIALTASTIAYGAGHWLLVLAVVAEVWRLREWWQAISGGLAIALIGYFWGLMWEPGQGLAGLSFYGLSAFLMSGGVGGVVYWALAGRYAGRLRQ